MSVVQQGLRAAWVLIRATILLVWGAGWASVPLD